MAAPAHWWDKSEFVIILKRVSLVNVFLGYGKGERTFEHGQLWSFTFEHLPYHFHCRPGWDFTDFLATAQTFAE
jgi:hypothetical protein